MAIFHCSTKLISRSAGRSAVAAAAYRSATRLTDQRTGLSHDYTKKQGVMQAYTLLPSGQQVEREALWNAAEMAEKRKDARTAREWIIAIPEELVPRTEQMRKLITGSPDFELVEQFAKALSQRYQVAVEVAIHAPDKEGDQRNYHAHILTTTRQVQEQEGTWVLTTKSPIELSDTDRRKQGLGSGADEVKAVRQLWETLANAKLEQERKVVRIDHRSFKDQGIDQAPSVHLGYKATEMERKKLYSDRGDLNRRIAYNNYQRHQLKAELIDLTQEREKRPKPSVAVVKPAPTLAQIESVFSALLKEAQTTLQTEKEQAQNQLNQAKQALKAWQQQQPKAPTGLFSFFKKEDYQKDLAQWEQTHTTLKNTQKQAQTKYDKERPSAKTLAQHYLEQRYPDLAKEQKRLEQVKQQQAFEAQQAKEQAEAQAKREKQERDAAERKAWADVLRSQHLETINRHPVLKEIQRKIDSVVKAGRDRADAVESHARMIEKGSIRLGQGKSQGMER